MTAETPDSVASRLGVRARHVVVAGEFAPDRFGTHIAETLEAMGCNVTRFEMGHRSQVQGKLRHRVRLAREMLDNLVLERVPAARRHRLGRLIAAAAGAELLLLTYDYLLPKEVEVLKTRADVNVALWYPDHIGNMGRMAWLAADYDGVFVKDPYIVHALSEYAMAPVHYLPEAYNPLRHRLPDGVVDRTAYACEITTAGTLHAPRFSVFRQLQEFDVRIWGDPPPWWLDTGPVAAMHQGRPVMNEEKAVAFTSASVVLNTLYPTEIWGLNARAFEAAGVGAFQVLDWRPGLSQLFHDGSEVVSFRGTSELKEKLRYYLGRPEERAAIAAAAAQRAAGSHTYALRLATLLRTVDDLEAGHPLPPTEPSR